MKGHHPESVRRGLRDNKAAPTPEFNTQGDYTIKVYVTNWKLLVLEFMMTFGSVLFNKIVKKKTLL